MKHIRKLSVILVLCLLLAALPATPANAAESGSLWMNQIATENGTVIAICADTAAASGVITVTYDTGLLTFEEMTVDSTYILAHAINDKKAGTLQISWIGTGADAAGDGYALLRLRFTGAPDQNAVLTGSVYDAVGNALTITTLNFTGLSAALADGAAVNAADYTADSYAALQSAMAAADPVLTLETVTQAQLDAAAQAVTAALEALELYAPEPTPPAPTEPAPTEPAPTEPQPTQPVTNPIPTPTETQPTTTPAPQPQPAGNNGWMLIVLAVLCIAAVAAAVVILKKRGRK